MPGCPLCHHLISRDCSVSQSPLLRIRGDEEEVSLGNPWSHGLGSVPSSAGEPDPSSVPPPCRGGSEKEGVRDPAFWARKAEKAEVRDVRGPLATGLSPTMQTPADFPRVERDLLPCPRKVSRGLASLQQCLSPRLCARSWFGGGSPPWGFRVTASVPREYAQSEANRWRLRPQGWVGRGC